jgi:outer membrane protein assembly factor BamD (BamD/ComL family)
MRSLVVGCAALATVFVATQAMSQPAPAPQPAAQPQPAGGQAPLLAAATAGGAETGCSARTARGSSPSLPRNQQGGPPDPTAEQLQALAELQKEAAAYTVDAKAYRRAITRIVRHHYEDKKRRILSSLNREIGIESDGLKAARDEAIKRLEAFVEKYSGDEAHPKNTPDALFRLAALYEEKEREISDTVDFSAGEALPEPDLSKAIALYKRIVNEYKNYDELAGVFYYLGHAYNDMGRLEEAQQVYRSLVCRNHFSYPVPPDPEDPEKDGISRLPQDHDAEWWLGWMSRHPEPVDHGAAPSIPRRGAPLAADVVGDEDIYRNPFPDDCQPVAQKTLQGADPRYVAEIWWRIGDHHFEEIDPFGGPYNLNRAESAYRQSMKFTKPPVFGVSMYKLAWTFYKQQRYEAAVKQFVELLHYTDKREKETGNPGADFRAEAYAYIAGSVTYLDFEGPGPDDPYIARNDIFDLESDGAVIEEKMHVAIDRLQNPDLVPQDKKWTVEIYKALAFEYKEYNHYHNLVDVSTMTLQKWPMHRDAPSVQNQIAAVYEQLAGQTRGAEHDKYEKLALNARGKLVNYVATPGNIPEWVQKNKDDPEAIRAAERLVRGGLQRAAADHTNAARRSVGLARAAADPEERQAGFQQALEQYRLAAKAWGGYLLQDENAEDAYESRYWLADAFTNTVLIRVQLGEMPSPKEIELARCHARDVRDSNEDDKYLQPAALMVVRIAQQLAAANYKLHEDTNGSRGFAEVTELEERGEGKQRKYVKKELPKEIKEMILGFDEYIARVPIEKDPFKNHERFAYTAGEIPFLYGQFEEARRRLNPIYISQCGKSKYGYLAWEKLLTMANKDENFDESRKLAEASTKKSCATTADQEQAESGIRDPTIKRGYYQQAAAAYEAAQKMKDGPERKKAWLKAAQLYEGALKAAPDRKEAPEAAILGASAYKQIGEYDKAIAMYELFIKEYGKDELLDTVKNGDPKKGTPPNKADYEDRIKYLKVAYDALAEAYVLFFDYRRAANTYQVIAKQNRFSGEQRREAARNAVFLYANIGERAKMAESKQTFTSMNPTQQEMAELDWLIASADLKEWDSRGPKGGSNGQARTRATRSMDSYYRKYSGNRQAHAFTVQAAYHGYKMRRIGGDPNYKRWSDNTIKAFDNYKSVAAKDEKGRNTALSSLQSDMAAECHYREIDAEIKRKFDYESGHHRYKGVIIDITKDFKKDVETGAKGYYDRLQEVITKYESRRWAVAARARQGSLYDSTRTGLYNAREPALKLYTKKEDKLLKQLDDLCVNQGNDNACDKYDTFTANRRTQWRKSRDQYLADADKAMVRGYVESILWAEAWKVRVDSVDKAIARLAFFTDIIGDAKLRDYSNGLKDPVKQQPFVYTDGTFLRMRRGMTTQAKPKLLPAPLPVVP